MTQCRTLISGLSLTLSAALFTACGGQPEPIDPGPQVYSSVSGETLSDAVESDPLEAVRGFLGDKRSLDHAGLLSVSVRPAPTGILHVRIEQVVDGLPVAGAYARAAFDGDGRLIHLIDRLVSVQPGGVAPSSIGEADALAAALRFHRYDSTTPFLEPPSVARVAIADGRGALRAGFRVTTWSLIDNSLIETLVDGDGRVVSVENRTASDSYKVFTVSPDEGAQVVVDGPAPGGTESPVGWLGGGSELTINITGNNAHAYLDVLPNNQPDRGGDPVTDGQFLAVADLTQSPLAPTNQAVAVQNLFYLNNVIHDDLYRHGFNEAAGNFQTDNFGRGGADSDAVLAEAQDGSGTDNANFSTPADGKPGRMQMFLWSPAGPDAEVVIASPTAATYAARTAGFGGALDTAGVAGNIVLVDDGVGATSDGCEGAQAAVSGQIALIDRGTCAFVDKVLNAQIAGAVGVIVANNVGGDAIFTMGGTSRRIRIPAVMIGQDDGAALEALGAAVAGTQRKLATLPPQRDGDVDSDVVFHEYCHGLTWRMIGGMSGPLAGAIGEGMSDGCSLLENNDDVVGEYAFGNPLGIRSSPYAGYPRTYGDVAGTEVHLDGEVYGAIVWRLIEIFARDGIPQDVLFDYIVDGMNFTPATPAWEDMRDGILQSVADRGQGHECQIWEAFAQFGVGVGASGTTDGTTVTIIESFATPASCP